MEFNKDAFTLILICLLISILVVCLIWGYSNMSTENNLYSIPATIQAVDHDTIIIKDIRGEVWAYENDCAWEKGDKITIIFDSHGTGNLKDDEIISINWIGEYE